MGVLARFSVPKSPDYVNEDRFALSDRVGRYALSDGASVSFDSASWARIISVRYVQEPRITDAWLAEAIRAYEVKYDRDALPWTTQGAYDRGSFASLVGVLWGRGEVHVEVFAVGDTVAVLCDGFRIVGTFPYVRSQQFSDPPELISTQPQRNVFLQEAEFPASRGVRWCVSDLVEPRVLCMTDALGQWFMSRHEAGEEPAAVVLGIENRHTFRAFVKRERAAGHMRRDDTTLIVLGTGDGYVSPDC